MKIIAEIGVNHNGDIAEAKDLVSSAARAGATHVKFQMFDPELLVSPQAPLAKYQIDNGVLGKSQFEMLEALSLNRDEILELDEFSSNLGLPIIATPFDLGSLSFLVSELKHSTIKIGSGDLTFVQLIFEAAKSGADLIISTGMSYLREVENAVEFALAGRAVFEGALQDDFSPTRANLKDLPRVKKKNSWLTLLHCTSTYPAPSDQINITAISELGNFDANLGYSDHSLSSHASVMALALGAEVFEKHLTLKKDAEGPDHAASLDPEQFSQYVTDLRIAESSMGDGVKRPQTSEIDVRGVARRSLFAAQPMRAGSPTADLIALRPASYVSAESYYEILKTLASTDYSVGDPIID